MESLYDVLGQRTGDLVRLLVDLSGFTAEGAERFVAVAGVDLIESIEWKAPDLDLGSLAAPANVRDVLSVLPARRLSSTLGIPQADVWAALRTFVPRFLQMADRWRGNAGHAHPQRDPSRRIEGPEAPPTLSHSRCAPGPGSPRPACP